MVKNIKYFVLGALFLAACGRESDVRREARENMVAGCVGELGIVEGMLPPERIQAFCECAVNRIIRNYTDAELVIMGTNPEQFEDRSQEDAVQAIAACQQYLM